MLGTVRSKGTSTDVGEERVEVEDVKGIVGINRALRSGRVGM